MATSKKNTVVMIMAGGKGARLSPQTCHRSKPAVPFGCRYRIIDFVLTNFLNSGYRQIYVLTQYMASSLIKTSIGTGTSRDLGSSSRSFMLRSAWESSGTEALRIRSSQTSISSAIAERSGDRCDRLDGCKPALRSV
ncbi:MAG: hypothetical protein GY811_12585 [Myxococcales bacterium]|nr:hypothetical protein [Myxococcales bacterium]